MFLKLSQCFMETTIHSDSGAVASASATHCTQAGVFLHLFQTLPSASCAFTFRVSYSLASAFANRLKLRCNEEWLGLCYIVDSTPVAGACHPLYWPPVPKGLPQQFRLSYSCPVAAHLQEQWGCGHSARG